ncbi:MAG: YbaK/EbsC family protein [Candidatus Diapherotrites archaeon]|uniref:YbaK/EbsC family protein n=1 Tax=Candidatus Iainarchaeum sp. TaxID=3101447 RepID=A0A8T4LA56_9ARCH|nr:YbaK/EbsC family protein [Candidatus Diapherotrites archaeon]
MKSLDFLKSKGTPFKTIELAEEPKSAQDVERLYGCPLKQVLKTLVFIGEAWPVLAVIPGDKRVDVEKLKEAAGQRYLRMASAQEVQQATGYPVGGVTPLGVEGKAIKVLDPQALTGDKVNIGSGKAEIGIELKSADLKKVWEGKIASITRT